jgi:hypothetical protein
MYPSFIAMTVSGFLLMGVIIYLFYKSRDPSSHMSVFENSMIVIGVATVISVHGIAHAYAEVNYGFNPLRGKWKYKNKLSKKHLLHK